jgi:hypothetical protein
LYSGEIMITPSLASMADRRARTDFGRTLAGSHAE